MTSIKPKMGPAELDALRQFDSNHNFGPAIGISRRERWERAQRFDRNPPPQVLEIIAKFADEEAKLRPYGRAF